MSVLVVGRLEEIERRIETGFVELERDAVRLVERAIAVGSLLLEALKREEDRRAVAAHGGDVAELYALIRRALSVADRAEVSPDMQTEISIALRSLYRAEDAVASAVRGRPSLTDNGLSGRVRFSRGSS